MEYLNSTFLVILYFLLIILVIVLIVLATKLLATLKKFDKVVDDISEKVNKLNNLFSIVDIAADTLSIMSDRVVSIISNGIGKIFRKNKKREDEENE